ncbi:hypothetical protein ABZV75_16090 [Streptomyces flaveolus]|uniref:hypothetical protein n=1 Tax=Streptomyces flaveolus TaxID=67297 RepID=UPI0033BD045E
MTAVGCSSEESKREFTVPKSLCGVSVPADALSRLLPASGKHITADQSGSLDDGSGVCAVKVDADTVLEVSGERIDAGDSARNILRSRLSVHQDQKSAENNSIAYADHAAVSLIRCRGADIQEEDISTLIKVLKPARPDESAMKKLIQGYTRSLKGQEPCKARS